MNICTLSRFLDTSCASEIEYPSSPDQFVPFLGTQIRIDNRGNLEYKYYRKEQKKQITLNYRSHHPMKTKVEVARNFYKTASISSSSPELVEKSFQVIDRLLRNNGYPNPRQFVNQQLKGGRVKQDPDVKTVTLKLPYITEDISEQIFV